MQETFRNAMPTGTSGRPRRRSWRHVLIAQVVKRYKRCWRVATERRMIEGTPARVETRRRWSQGDGVINIAYIERFNATFRERLVALTRHGRGIVVVLGLWLGVSRIQLVEDNTGQGVPLQDFSWHLRGAGDIA
jgi:hypothetical protein